MLSSFLLLPGLQVDEHEMGQCRGHFMLSSFLLLPGLQVDDHEMGQCRKHAIIAMLNSVVLPARPAG
jgi:hypothetical protein